MKILTKILCGTAVMLALAGWSGFALAAAAGQVQFVAGTAQLTTEAGKTRLLRKGDPVNEGDTLATAPAAALQVKMRDGGVVAMRADTRLKIDNFKLNDKEDGSERSNFSL